MLSIVTDPDTDYIFVTDFDVLEEHLNNILQQACRTLSTSTTSTLSTPLTSTTTSARVTGTGPGESTFLHIFCRPTGVRPLSHRKLISKLISKFVLICSFRKKNF